MTLASRKPPTPLRTTLTRAALPILSLAVAACGSETNGDPSPTSAKLSAGPFDVAPGTELVMCTYVRADNEEAADITLFHSEQSEGGHHLIVYTVDHAIDLPPSLCSQGGQPSWNQVVASQLKKEDQKFPEGVGYHIKPHQQFVLETHYINTTSAPLSASSSLELTFAEEGTVKQRAGTYFFGTMNIDVPPNGTFSKTALCKPPVPMTLHTMFGHEHRRGVGVSVGHAPGAGAMSPVYETKEWDAPPVAVFEEGMSLTTSDTIQVTCDWKNDEPTGARFPHEMCFAIGYYWPSEGTLTCSSGGGKDDCICQTSGTLDTGEGGAEIDVTVTRAETIAGSVGDLSSGAPIYCALFREEDWAGFLPKDDAQPYYFRDAVDVPLKTPSDEASFVFNDVTPGDYVVTCVMDSIGGGFLPGTGDPAVSMSPHVTAVKGKPVKVSAVLDFAFP